MPDQHEKSGQGPSAFHVMTKPVGPICNLDCKYCFYLEKEGMFPRTESFRMSDQVLESYVRQYIASQDTPEIQFAWQGGEPTLLGLDFFQRAVALQEQYADGKTIRNAIQTNGTLLDDAWCAFLAEHQFLVGLSLDGPRGLHDRYRVDKRRKPTFELVMRGLECLKKHKAEFNTLTVVSDANAQHPLDVYRFLKDIGSGFIQFIPLVERLPSQEARSMGFDLNLPPATGTEDETTQVTAWTVGAEAYGSFLVSIFDEWVRGDVGKVFVQIFDVALGQWMGAGPGLCVFAPRCGDALAMEHNGDLFACDHYVYPEYKLGNIMDSSMAGLVGSPRQRAFGRDKLDQLPRYCQACEVRFACNGDCPKHRFIKTPDGEPGLSYLCPAYKQFFNHVDPYMKVMSRIVRAGRPAASVMPMVAEQDQRARQATAKRNDPCPCGSGRKFKHCCASRRGVAPASDR